MRDGGRVRDVRLVRQFDRLELVVWKVSPVSMGKETCQSFFFPLGKLIVLAGQWSIPLIKSLVHPAQ